MLAKLYIIVSLIIDIFACIFGGVINSVLDIWKPILLFVGCFIGLIILHLLFVCAIAIFVDIKKPNEKPHMFFRWCVDKTMELLLFVLGVKVKVNGVEKIPTDRRFLMVSNHLSGFDPISAIVAFVKYNLIFVSKPEIFKIPVVAQFIHKSGFLAIDRDNARNAMKTIHKCTDYVKDDVASVCIYPEGTRSRNGDLLEFKDGVFYVCKKAQCPLVVITVKYDGKPLKTLKSTVFVDVVNVIEPKEFADKSTHELSEDVRLIMNKSLKN